MEAFKITVVPQEMKIIHVSRRVAAMATRSLMQLLFQTVVEEMLLRDVIQCYALTLCIMVIFVNVRFGELFEACGQ